ncbi:glutaminyl-peptide cyclotransferase [Devosia sp. Naph2]|uniref:Vgb family protein n=1 Tax=Devosia polycyclovorans TaxID=3345148 RepID=UPI0035CF8398
MKSVPAEILKEYGPFPGVTDIHGVTYDGDLVWFASGDRLNTLNPVSGQLQDGFDTPAYAGTAFDGTHLFQIAEDRINRLDPETGTILSSIPTPGDGASGLAWAEGSLWVGEYRAKRIHQVDPATGEVLRSIEATRFVTGVTWSDGQLWHGTWQDDQSDIRHIDPETGQVIEVIEMPQGMGVSGLESDGGDRFYCGGGSSGRLRVVRRP